MESTKRGEGLPGWTGGSLTLAGPQANAHYLSFLFPFTCTHFKRGTHTPRSAHSAAQGTVDFFCRGLHAGGSSQFLLSGFGCCTGVVYIPLMYLFFI